jgi:hypothetical protein
MDAWSLLLNILTMRGDSRICHAQRSARWQLLHEHTVYIFVSLGMTGIDGCSHCTRRKSGGVYNCS